MKVHQLALGALKDQQEPPSLTLACKSFISGANHNVQVGTRWNPTEDQITILEALYKGGMHTPNATEIERITRDLSKYGRIEGKNVFYWFQNHKARERQRQKRNLNFVDACLRLNGEATMAKGEKMKDGGGICKRKCRSWGVRCFDEDDNKTLELFPLHPEGR